MAPGGGFSVAIGGGWIQGPVQLTSTVYSQTIPLRNVQLTSTVYPQTIPFAMCN